MRHGYSIFIVLQFLPLSFILFHLLLSAVRAHGFPMLVVSESCGKNGDLDFMFPKDSG
jgi:membrane-bound acyltransferase YfiQ involved in biofilm formation